MKLIIAAIGTIITTSAAFADMSTAMLDRDKFVAVATAIVSKSKVRMDQGIKSITKGQEGAFLVQLSDSNNECVEIPAQVTVISASGERPQYSVDFPRVAPRPCL